MQTHLKKVSNPCISDFGECSKSYQFTGLQFSEVNNEP
jgi:hypothetical protein